MSYKMCWYSVVLPTISGAGNQGQTLLLCSVYGAGVWRDGWSYCLLFNDEWICIINIMRMAIILPFHTNDGIMRDRCNKIRNVLYSNMSPGEAMSISFAINAMEVCTALTWRRFALRNRRDLSYIWGPCVECCSWVVTDVSWTLRMLDRVDIDNVRMVWLYAQ